MKALVNIGGNLFPAQEAKVSVFDRGFLFGDGIYETGSSSSRVLLYLEEHLARFRRSAGRLKIGVPGTDEFLTQELKKTAKAFGEENIYFRMILTRGEVSEVGLDVEPASPTLVIIVQPFPKGVSEKQTKGYSLLTSKIVRNASNAQDPDIKTSNYLNSLLALQDVKARGAMDAVLCDSEGHVAEGTTFSIFALGADGILRTPSLEVGILESITRRHVLELAKKLGPVEEGRYKLSDFKNAKEIFIASSVRQVCPVYQWDEKKFQGPFEYSQKVLSLLQGFAAEYIRSHAPF